VTTPSQSQEDSLPLAIARRVDAASYDFEMAWKDSGSASQRPRVEDFLKDTPPPARAALVRELVALDIAYRRRAGEAPLSDDYHTRFPDLDPGWLRGQVGPRSGTTADAIADAAGLRYRILRPHARGGLGEVYVALDQEVGREVALKKIHADLAPDPVGRGRFIREAEITGGLEHPGIVPVYGLGLHADGRPFYAMRFVKGETLHEAIRRFHYPETQAAHSGERRLAFRALLRRFIDVCNAISYAHSRGVLHRDLKPDNIMLGEFGETLIIDWGLARADARGDHLGKLTEYSRVLDARRDLVDTQDGTTLGTPSYMSPEQAAGRPDLVGPASDIYGLGATLYCLLTGRAPVLNDDVRVVLECVQAGRILPPRTARPDAPAALEAVCRKAMALRPSDRYPSAKDLSHDLEQWLADEPISAYAEPLGQRLARWGRRHRPLVAGALALVATGVVALAVGLFAVNQEKNRTAHALQELAIEQKSTQAALSAEAKRRLQTRQALDALSSEVIDEWLAKQSGLGPEHKKFLEHALASYEEFAADLGPDEEARASVAAAHLRVGNLRVKLGQTAEAQAALERSRDLYTRLGAENPSVTAYRESLGAVHQKLANLLKESGRFEQAEAVYQEALAIQERLAADFPSVPSYRQNVAILYNNWGDFYRQIGRPRQAEAAHRGALDVHQRLMTDFPTVPTYRRELARSHCSLAIVLAATGRPLDSEAALREALAILQSLAADWPETAAYHQETATALNNLGILLSTSGRPNDGETVFRDAIALQQPLATEFPTVPAYRQELARTYHNLGNLLTHMSRPDDAAAAYRDALAIQQRLASEFVTVREYRHEQARSLLNLGNLYDQTGRCQQAEAALRDALAILRLLAADFPSVVAYRHELALAHVNLANVVPDIGHSEEAGPSYRDALAILQRLAADFPSNADYQNELAMTMVNLANLLCGQGETGAARQLLIDAAPHNQAARRLNDKHPKYLELYWYARLVSAKVQAAVGEHGEAAATVGEVLQGAIKPHKYTYMAAGILASCVPLAKSDPTLPEGEREQRAATYVEQGMKALRQAIQGGFKDIGRLKKENALDPLRGREDFQRLVFELESK
jgi:serine/threonine-protein kinase